MVHLCCGTDNRNIQISRSFQTHLDNGAVEPTGVGDGFSTAGQGSFTEASIAMKELISIDFAAAMWGRERLYASSVITKQWWQSTIIIQQGPHAGPFTALSDAISRNSNDKFFRLFPQALQTASEIPRAPPPQEIVYRTHHDWTSQSWMKLFSHFIEKHSHHRQNAHTSVDKSDFYYSANEQT